MRRRKIVTDPSAAERARENNYPSIWAKVMASSRATPGESDGFSRSQCWFTHGIRYTAGRTWTVGEEKGSEIRSVWVLACACAFT